MTLAQEKFYRATVVSRKEIAADLWTIRIQPGGEFHFTAGQYATLGVQTSSKHVERPYSMASSPYENEIEFFFERVPQGELTPLLYQLQVGDSLTLRKTAKGRFVLDTASGRTNHLLLATVTGVAPFVSFLRTLTRDAKAGRFAGQHRLFLLEGASRSQEFGYHDEIAAYAAEAPGWITYVPTVSRPWEDPQWKGEVGRVDDLIRKYTDAWGLRPENTTAYLCGHPHMIEHGKGILARRGWTKEALREEVYFVPKEQPAATEQPVGGTV